MDFSFNAQRSIRNNTLPFGSQQRSTLSRPSSDISPFNLLNLREDNSNTCNLKYLTGALHHV